MSNPRIVSVLATLSIFAASHSFAVTLNACLEAALESNPSLEAAAQRVAVAASAIDSARSGYYPTLGLAGSYTLTDNAPQAFFMNLNQRTATLDKDFNQPGDTDNLRGSVMFRMMLLDGGQRGLMTDMAIAGTDTATAMLDATRNELVYEVTRAYHSVLQSTALLAVREETVASIEENLRVANERMTAGSVIKTDVLNLEVQLAEAREELIRASNGQKLAIAALNTAIGRDLVADAASLDSVASESLSAPPATIDMNRVEDRPEWTAYERQVDAAELDAKRVSRDKLPKVSAFGSLDADSGDADQFEDSYLVGAMVELDLFTGFRRQSEHASATARANEVRAQRDHIKNQLMLDLKRSHLMTQETWERWQVANASEANAEESLRITRERYEQGAAEITELLTAQVGRTASRSRSVAALYDYLIARANLERAQGTSMEQE